MHTGGGWVYLPRGVYLPGGWVGVPAQRQWVGVPAQAGVPAGGCTCLACPGGGVPAQVPLIPL